MDDAGAQITAMVEKLVTDPAHVVGTLVFDRDPRPYPGMDQDIVAELLTAVTDVDDLAHRADKITAAVRDRLT